MKWGWVGLIVAVWATPYVVARIVKHRHPGVVDVELVSDDVKTSLWCDHCKLPSAYEATMLFTVDGTPHSLLPLIKCFDCDRQWEAR